MIKNKTLKIFFRFSNSLLFYKILENCFKKLFLKTVLKSCFPKHVSNKLIVFLRESFTKCFLSRFSKL